MQAPSTPKAQSAEVSASKPQGKPHESSSAESDHTPEVIVLSELEEQILAYAKEHGAFRMEELKKAIPTLAEADPKAFKSFRQQFARIRNRIAKHCEQQAGPAGWVEGDGLKRAKTYELVPDGQEPKGAPEKSVKSKAKSKPAAAQKPVQEPADEAPESPVEVQPEAVCIAETKWGAKILKGDNEEPYLVFNGQTISMRAETVNLFAKLLAGGSKLYDDMLSELLADYPEMTKDTLNGMIHELENFFEKYADKELFQYKMINTQEGRQRLLGVRKEASDFLARAQADRAQK